MLAVYNANTSLKDFFLSLKKSPWLYFIFSLAIKNLINKVLFWIMSIQITISYKKLAQVNWQIFHQIQSALTCFKMEGQCKKQRFCPLSFPKTLGIEHTHRNIAELILTNNNWNITQKNKRIFDTEIFDKFCT